MSTDDTTEDGPYRVRQDGVEVGRFVDKRLAFNWAAALSWDGEVEVWFETERLWTNVAPPFSRAIRVVRSFIRRLFHPGSSVSYEIRQDNYIVGTEDDFETAQMRAIMLERDGQITVYEVRRRILLIAPLSDRH